MAYPATQYPTPVHTPSTQHFNSPRNSLGMTATPSNPFGFPAYPSTPLPNTNNDNAFNFNNTNNTSTTGINQNSNSNRKTNNNLIATPRYRNPLKYTHLPLNSSPLAGGYGRVDVGNEAEDDMDDDRVERRSSPTPSSPLAYSAYNTSNSAGNGSLGLGFPSASTDGQGVGEGGGVRPHRAFSATSSRTQRVSEHDLDPDSPLVQRRRAQYKARSCSAASGSKGLGGSISQFNNSNSKYGGKQLSLSSPTFSGAASGSADLFASNGNTKTTPEDPQKAFLRERFKMRCFERAAKAREKAVRERRGDLGGGDHGGKGKGKSRRRMGMSSDGFEEDGMGVDMAADVDGDNDDEEGDEEIMRDELFRRIMANVNRKLTHSYRVSYALEVGSSFDPDMEDVSAWEDELKAPPNSSSSNQALSQKSITAYTRSGAPSPALHLSSPSTPRFSSSTPQRAHPQPSPFSQPSGVFSPYHPVQQQEQEPELSPADLEDAELEAYAEECAQVMDEQAMFDEYQKDLEYLNREAAERKERARNVVRNVLGSEPQDGMTGLEGLEGVPEEELFGAWNWSESDGEGLGEDVDVEMEMDLS